MNPAALDALTHGLILLGAVLTLLLWFTIKGGRS